MGKPRMNLLNGIEEQENAIESNITPEDARPQTQKAKKTATKPKTKPEPPTTAENTQTENTAEKTNTKTQKQSFSFRADINKIEHWKLYADTIGTKDIGTLWSAAIDEYISNHKLTANQQAIYDLKKKAAELAKNEP